jgi:hypothetical protein
MNEQRRAELHDKWAQGYHPPGPETTGSTWKHAVLAMAALMVVIAFVAAVATH